VIQGSETSHARILVVDDDEIILIALGETLKHEGYEAITTQSPREALEFLKKKSFAVVISDQRMAEMTGLEFLQEAARVQPTTSRILITGVLTLKTIIDAINTGEIFRFISKPWLREELLATIRNATQRHDLLETNKKLQEDTQRLNTQLAEANAHLKDTIRTLTAQKNELLEMHDRMKLNFEHSLDLVQRIVSVYLPRLGDETLEVVTLCERMTDISNLEKSERDCLLIAARIYNIGLIGMPRDLLEKARNHPSEMEESERNVMRSGVTSAQMLADYVDPTGRTGRIIRACRERWDGEGYPDGLAGEEIPVAARMLSVAVWYVESSLPRDDRLDEILHLDGTAFSFDAVQTFMKATRTVPTSPRNKKKAALSELKPGMMLAEGIYSPSGMLIIPEGQRITEESLRLLKTRGETPEGPNLQIYS
jgi:response regulator RpfG family c-di-GMP phosphodiesterase